MVAVHNTIYSQSLSYVLWQNYIAMNTSIYTDFATFWIRLLTLIFETSQHQSLNLSEDQRAATHI